MHSGTPRRPTVVLVAVLLLAGGVAAQDDLPLPPDADADWREDPYTRGEPDALAEAGYVAIDRLPWGDDHSTPDIERALGSLQTLWIETAHFRIGSTLPEYKIPKEDKDKLRDELTALSKRLPRVKDRTRTLDRWLRAHLYAARLEALYARVQEVLGVTDADFPATTEEGATRDPFMGNGPYLGRRDKFCVLLLEKKSSLGRYAQRYGQGQGGDGSGPLRLGFHGRGSMAFATAEEFFVGHYENDVSLHCHVVFNMTQLLLDGFKDYYHAFPRWVGEGLGHVLQREIDEDYPTFSYMKEPVSQVIEETDWGRKVRARVKVDYYPAARELMRWPGAEELEFANHCMMWARVDFLVREHADGFAAFLHAFKAPLPVTGRLPTTEEVLDGQDRALEQALGWDDDAFDDAWSEWVLRTYPKR